MTDQVNTLWFIGGLFLGSLIGFFIHVVIVWWREDESERAGVWRTEDRAYKLTPIVSETGRKRL